jgi:hypothetical protein
VLEIGRNVLTGELGPRIFVSENVFGAQTLLGEAVTALRVSLYGAGQVGGTLSRLLSSRAGIEVLGPFRRGERERALRSGADVVVIATTSFLRDVAPDIRAALEAGSNVITTAEEAAFPWAVAPTLADELDSIAREQGVTVVGCGLNPGFAFDALVATASGVAWAIESIRVERIVDLSGFGPTVLKRIGVGHTIQSFEAGKQLGTVTGHIGFPQSMSMVGRSLGVAIDAIDREITPLVAKRRQPLRELTIEPGMTAGFRQRYLGRASGKPWFECLFTGHVDLAEIGEAPRDEIWIEGPTPVHLTVIPGLNPQVGVPAVLANSLKRLIAAKPGWLTVIDLPPATPHV